MITLDFRAGLAKVHQGLDELKPHLGQHLYSAPCAIGIMLTEDERAELDAIRDLPGETTLRYMSENSYDVRALIKGGALQLVVPTHKLWAIDLQKSFDDDDWDTFVATLDRITREMGATP